MRELVKGNDGDGKEVNLAVMRPSNKDIQEAQLMYNMRLAKFIREGATGGDRLLMRSELDQHLAKLGIWTAEDAKTYQALQESIRQCEVLLRKGGIKLSEGRELALRIADVRTAMIALYMKRSQFDNTTAEANAEQYRFGYLMTVCVVLADGGERYLPTQADYETKGTEPVVIEAARTLAKMLYGADENFANGLFENRWLTEHGYRNDQGRLVNREGHLVDREGRLVNEQGRFVDLKGNFVDLQGNPVDENGELVIEGQPFIDDDAPPTKKKGKAKVEG